MKENVVLVVVIVVLRRVGSVTERKKLLGRVQKELWRESSLM